MMLTIVNSNREALLSISGTRLWSGQNAQGFNTNGISWGGLGPQMFGIHGVYHMVPICLAIGVFLPLPFIVAVSRSFPVPRHTAPLNVTLLVVHLAQGWLRELQHAYHPAVLVLPVRRYQHIGQPLDGDRPLLAVVGAHALPALVHEVQVRTSTVICRLARIDRYSFPATSLPPRSTVALRSSRSSSTSRCSVRLARRTTSPRGGATVRRTYLIAHRQVVLIAGFPALSSPLDFSLSADRCVLPEN